MATTRATDSCTRTLSFERSNCFLSGSDMSKRPLSPGESERQQQGAAKVARSLCEEENSTSAGAAARDLSLSPSILKAFPPTKLCDVTLRVIGHDDWGVIQCHRFGLWKACSDPKHAEGEDQPISLFDGSQEVTDASDATAAAGGVKGIVIWLATGLFQDADEFVSAVTFLLDFETLDIPKDVAQRSRLEKQLNQMSSFGALNKLLSHSWYEVSTRTDKTALVERCKLYRRGSELAFLATRAAKNRWTFKDFPKELIPAAAQTWFDQAKQLQTIQKAMDAFLATYKGPAGKCTYMCPSSCDGKGMLHYGKPAHFVSTQPRQYDSSFVALGKVYNALDTSV
jgi:hypothetical protein